ncbi:uncharacterized protein LOC110118934 [Ceratitis capitata]|uniref:uncharacterized protein LOC110118934 n=1 Tax=Ceratitis capitata TaxID=7213 RepID=UPI000A0F9E3A|nr:uncharacterized protein LOC110118934 [Ceratitis capitata]
MRTVRNQCNPTFYKFERVPKRCKATINCYAFLKATVQTLAMYHVPKCIGKVIDAQTKANCALLSNFPEKQLIGSKNDCETASIQCILTLEYSPYILDIQYMFAFLLLTPIRSVER